MSRKIKTPRKVKIVTEGGIPVRQVGVDGYDLADPTYRSSTPIGVTEATEGQTGILKVRLVGYGLPVVNVNETFDLVDKVLGYVPPSGITYPGMIKGADYGAAGGSAVEGPDDTWTLTNDDNLIYFSSGGVIGDFLLKNTMSAGAQTGYHYWSLDGAPASGEPPFADGNITWGMRQDGDMFYYNADFSVYETWIDASATFWVERTGSTVTFKTGADYATATNRGTLPCSLSYLHANWNNGAVPIATLQFIQP